MDNEFVKAWNILAARAAETARAKGWTKGNDGEAIALVHAELSEMLEWVRRGNPMSDHIPDFSGAEEEAADVVIRLMHMAALRDWRVAEAVIAKLVFNKAREFKHGGKLF